MLCTEEKLALLQAHSADLARQLQLWSPRDLDRVKGRFLHYSQAIRHLRIRVTEMQRLMGPVALGEAYDSPGPLPTGLAELAAEMGAVVGRFGSVGTPLWPAVASSAYSSLLSGEERRLFCSLTWDSSPTGWASLGRWWCWAGPEPVLRDLLLVGSWPASWDVSQQPFREALGGVLAFEALAQAVDISGRSCILRNDASAAMPRFARAARSPHKCSAARCASTGRRPGSTSTSCPTMFRA